MTSGQTETLTLLRAALHACPETALTEARTADTIDRFLRAHTSLSVTKKSAYLLATHFEGASLPTVAFRADMDAIKDGSGRPFHGCGHDGHCAILAGLGLAIEGKRIGKNVVLLFQSAEETGEGAKRVLAEWEEVESLSAIVGFHNLPGYPLGQAFLTRGCFALASEGLAVFVLGAQSHAAYPEQGKNPAALLSRLVLALPGMAERICAADRLLLSTVVGMQIGGKRFGVSAGEGALYVTLRAERDAELSALESEIRRFVLSECAKSGMRAAFAVEDAFPDTVNDPDFVEQSAAALTRAKIPFSFLPAPMRWSEDFGWYLKKVPGMYLGFGAGECTPDLHTDAYAFPDTLLAPAAEALLALACI